MSNIICPLLKKNQSVKYYINCLPIVIIDIIKNNIELKKNYKFKNHIKNNKKLLKQIKYKVVPMPLIHDFNNITSFGNIRIKKDALTDNYNNIYYKNHINRSQYFIITIFDITKKIRANKKLK